ncbi:MAG TPA: GNAT family N-acetyltransferase [Caulobacteraceae bacterium]|jgi:GNAT superfamily N-acetyltransferase|nr:GNAT family N-acetyltransferase [Caulobacteraceae bacterium]
MPTCRPATLDDIPELEDLIDQAIGVLLREFLTPDQLAASRAVMGLDSQLIADGTYVAAEAEGRIVGCGGWSRRATPYGGDHSAGRDAALLDPSIDPARIRAMYTRPGWERRGVGRLILAQCEAGAAAAGFIRTELTATLGGEPLYRACGYAEIERFSDATGGAPVPLVRMGKCLTNRHETSSPDPGFP